MVGQLRLELLDFGVDLLLVVLGARANQLLVRLALGVALRLLSGFAALVPAEHPPNDLADACVRAFDPFRAPLTAEDRARRNPSRLTPRQVEYLDRWGYPYVMEEFRFHMTLTGRLDETRRGAVLAMLRERFARLKLTELAIDRVALFKQADAKARFVIIGDWQLRAA